MNDPIGLKIVVLGAASVGKTSIIQRYCKNEFRPGNLATIGAEFLSHNVINESGNYNLLLWDTAGEERFKAVAPCLLHGADGLILVFDITSFQTFEGINDYYQMFFDTVEVVDPKNPPILLLANKIDIEDSPHIETHFIEQWCQEKGVVNFSMVSAKSGEGVREAIEEKLLKTIIDSKKIVPPVTIALQEPNKAKKKECC